MGLSTTAADLSHHHHTHIYKHTIADNIYIAGERPRPRWLRGGVPTPPARVGRLVCRREGRHRCQGTSMRLFYNVHTAVIEPADPWNNALTTHHTTGGGDRPREPPGDPPARVPPPPPRRATPCAAAPAGAAAAAAAQEAGQRWWQQGPTGGGGVVVLVVVGDCTAAASV